MKYFTIEELCRSSVADSKKIDNIPTKDIENKLIELVDNVLDKLRQWYGKPITVNSGYRCRILNEAVGGSKTSQHMLGEAADITAGSKLENEKLFNYIRDNLEYDQLINESDFTWIHVSYRKDRLRKQVKKL